MKQSLLWEINRADLPAPSYLFGTMHTKSKQAFGFQPSVFEKIEACEAFANEFKLDDADPIAMQEALKMPNGTTLKDYISPKKLAKIQRIIRKAFGVNIEALIYHKPFLITNLLTDKILAEEQQQALDVYLLEYAKKAGKQIMGIETFQEQLDILYQIPLKYQVKSLIDIAKNVKKYRKKLLYMADLYETADIQCIFKATKKNSGKLRKLMLYHRNEVMAKRIAQLVKEQSLFAAIGAAHLGGEKGVLKLLKQQDFLLKAV